ncbi:tumor necrosis factor receptor type 1-associated DEATH domain protein [Callorhinchus milii]|nr:tumor necrosis factor receptor type 1-associated DEATH domain protein [Callorhinchus milii]XP_042196390.1 tumor necrosis factor receptor type 1-associated DEATH domain protein [Callorhinchus milii]XP_042196391.1 tumor necrosis factor receptor type 1-associated DEATH domain protein [Callorhinchus milii]XP_042196392.1 tumor necrosis factor receptor type 1-associated DEATH domain protein [Callorhinchus milii]XP_042196393.1 tumor necrosis factor receptor type 1-associated DEATH domain protein [C|eukprot:gi/632972899/ref/XP_007902885.1/ PREDICTED: tumor necrosis factor receptor type 1-associated DEATH domain protein [Callorhinchus milii]
MDSVAPSWVGSAFLFIKSDDVDLSSLFQNEKTQLKVYKALKIALADATGSGGGCEILKVYESTFGMQLKFTKEDRCLKFLHSYKNKALQQALQSHFEKLSIPMTTFSTELKAGTMKLDEFLDQEEICIRHIKENMPNHLRDDKISELEEDLKRLVLCNTSYSSIAAQHSVVPAETPSPMSPSCLSSSSSSPSQGNGSPLCLPNHFEFHDTLFEDHVLNHNDHCSFAKYVGRNWKQVGRSLQANCRGLRYSAIDNIAYEFEREGLYEQAYQMLLKFIQCEGKKAFMSRLIAALEENELIGIAEKLLNISND